MTEKALIETSANDAAATARDPEIEKLIDAQVPGFTAEFDPDEATRLGAFREDAVSEADALASAIDPTL